MAEPLQFLGRISFSLYLFHEIFLYWPIANTTTNWMEQYGGCSCFNSNVAALFTFLIYTPLLILVSWIADILIDKTSQNLTRDIDKLCRDDNSAGDNAV